uniref:Apoptosis inducing factor mitochondria associated 4 n=1 Tax=Salarias fasciatus TaxID=181472 RepID=A0A672JG58_SALFA
MSQSREPGPHGEEEVTGQVCQEDDLQDGQMREVAVADQKVLLVRIQGQFYAVGSQCSHYNAPLIKGALVGDRVRCPFHGACFSVKTGDIEEYPGLDCLPSYKVKLIFLRFSEMLLSKRVKEMCRMSPDIKQVVLLVGGGPASLVCAETLRQNCFQGRIVILTKDTLAPFDKPKLSKALNVDSGSILLRSADFYQQYGIEVRTQTEVTNLAFCVVSRLSFCLSHISRPLSCPGSHLRGVKLLQSYEDAKEIHASCLGKKAVVVGASFIGMEVASYLSDKAASVALVGKTAFPYERSLGPEIGKMSMQMLEEQNVKFYMSDEVTEIRGEDGKVKEVVLKGGAILEADVVIAGIGKAVNIYETQHFTSNNPRITSVFIFQQFMRTSVAGIFSAGDVTSFPLSIRDDQRVHIGHWQMSQAQGRVAALNMLNKPTKIESVPFFWTVLLGKSIRYTGYGEGYTEIIFKGSVEDRKFLAFYIKDGVAVAAASLMFDPAVARIAELMANGQMVTKAQAQ